MSGTLSFDLEVHVSKREDCFAASTNPFAITTYGKSPEEAETRALKAVDMLLDKYENSELHKMLERLMVKHVMVDDGEPRFRPSVIRSSKQEIKRRVSAIV